MINAKDLEKKLSKLQERYINFMLENLKDWRLWAEASQKMADGKEINKEELPDFFHTEYEWAKIVLDMEDQGGFNWQDPRIANLFAAAAQTPFYKLWGDTITEVSLHLAETAEAKTLIEIGAGRGNLTRDMLIKMSSKNISVPLFASDANKTVLNNVAKLRDEFPSQKLQTHLWDVNKAPDDSLKKQIKGPVVLYERASITYATYGCLENIAQVADVIVLGDYFNFTGELFAYDTMFDRIGVKPLFYKDVEPLLLKHFPNEYLFDREVHASTGLPNISLVIAWK
jgi:hypothetical protein